MADRVRVIVADDHPLFREGLVRTLKLRPELQLVGETVDGRQALDQIRELAPDVAVLDVQLPDIDGIAVLQAIQREHLDTRAVVVSACYDGDTVYRALASGARGYLPKLASGDAICEAVIAVARGDSVIPSELQPGLTDQIRMRRDVADRPFLTPRELDILRLAADGLSTPEIATSLHVSSTTVKTHLQHVYEKLEVSDRAAAVAQAMRRGILR